MSAYAKTGVFLCQCGDKIASLVDLEKLQAAIGHEPDVAHCETLAYPCLKPGIEHITQLTANKGLNRIIVAGCEERLMAAKLEDQLRSMELLKGQIQMVNLRGHVATVSDLPPEQKADKAAKLISAAVAEMAALKPTHLTRAMLKGPVMIVGNGIASYSAAAELARQKVDYLLAVPCANADTVIAQLHQTYPGEHEYHARLKKTVAEALQSPHATLLIGHTLSMLSGVTGSYNLTFSNARGEQVKFTAGAIIACLDAHFAEPRPEFGHDGKTVLMPSEMEAHFLQSGVPKGTVVFWIRDYEIGQSEFAPLSAKSAWQMAAHIRQCAPSSTAIILYNQQMEVPLTAAERALNRKLNILWIPYDKALRPAVQDGFLTFCNLADHVEHELKWDYLVLSPERTVAGETLQVARILGLVHKEGRFLTGHHARVRPEMVGREETYLAGSARFPCSLHDALAQGKRAAAKTTEMFRKSAGGDLFVPRVVCVVDPQKCIGCGQCQELCDCGGIGVEEGPGGGLPRVVDPMVCTGGGTCAAACPYHALVLQNNSNDQREARVAALARLLGPDECMAFVCSWGGLPAADIAGKQGLQYDPRIYLLGVPCVGQIDACAMARALKEGAPGLLLVGCLPETCHHSYGLDHAWSRVNAIKKLLSLSGFDRQRIALAHADLNHPQDFVRTVESFTRMIAAMGPMIRSQADKSKLDAMYHLIRDNTRVRHLLSAGLRRPGEKTYRGDQRHALEYDRDFSAVLAEEFLQQRLLLLMRSARGPFNLNQLTGRLNEDPHQVATCLWDMVQSGLVDFAHINREAVYSLSS
ncbi:MAG: hydrogenase iron-sulfur subunit [Desulfobacteraceae bacterium]|nr:MAG: hydrogenase iron-sulfur subunit [Desulfobacteraceae bacterium]